VFLRWNRLLILIWHSAIGERGGDIVETEELVMGVSRRLVFWGIISRG
jgi:hypothetical protein